MNEPVTTYGDTVRRRGLRFRTTRNVVLGLLLVLWAGCTSGDDRVTVEFWAMGFEGEVVTELVPEFERTHPGIRIDVQQIPWTAAHEKLLTAYAGRALPDLCQLGNTWLPEMVALGALEPLDDQIARTPGISPDDYFPGIWQTNVIDGTAYGVPWYVDTRVLFYRQDLLRRAGYEQVPRTWDGWVEAMHGIKRIVGEDNYAVLLPVNEFEQPLIFALQQPGSYLREGDRYGNFRGEDFRRAFTFYVSLFEQGLAPEVANTQIGNVWQEFARGYFTFYITGPWQIGEFRRRLPDSLKDAWMTAPMPGPDSLGVSVAGGASLTIFSTSERKPEAWAFIEYLSRPDVQARFYELTGDLPPRQSTWERPVLKDNTYARAFRSQLQRVEPTPKIPEQERIAQKIREYAEAVVIGGMSIDEALRRLDADVDRILEKRRWLLERAEEERS